MNDKVLSETEKTLLLKVLAGKFPPFELLRKQVDLLSAKSRRKQYHVYQVEFEFEGGPSDVLNGREKNIQIIGTVFHVNESPVPFYARVIVLGGVIRYLNIGADYEFSREFSIKNIFWENRSDDPRKEGIQIYEADERDLKQAIGYIPTNR